MVRLEDLGSAASEALAAWRGVPETPRDRALAAYLAAKELPPALTRDPLRDPASRDPLRSGAPDPLRDPRSADPLKSGADGGIALSGPASRAG